jgi:hypothetical protein
MRIDVKRGRGGAKPLRGGAMSSSQQSRCDADSGGVMPSSSWRVGADRTKAAARRRGEGAARASFTTR